MCLRLHPCQCPAAQLAACRKARLHLGLRRCPRLLLPLELQVVLELRLSPPRCKHSCSLLR